MANFETWLLEGADTTNLTTANVLSVAGSAAQQITKGSASCFATFSAEHPQSGATGGKFVRASGFLSIARLPLDAPNANVGDLSASQSIYFWYSGTPPTLDETIDSLRNSGGVGARVSIQATTGKLVVHNTLATAVWTATAALPSAGMYRADWYITVATSTTGILHIGYAAGDNRNYIQESGAVTGLNFGTTNIIYSDVGAVSTGASAFTVWIDSVRTEVARTSYIGPYTVNNPIMTTQARRRAANW